MSGLLLTLVGLGSLLALMWGLAGGIVLVGSRKVKLLAEVLPQSAGLGAEGNQKAVPLVSVVVTARNEAESVESTVRSLLRQNYPRLEIIVVDDRSSDGTWAILERLAGGDPKASGRLQIVRIEELPRGWTGKCHACHLGAARSAGGWILFTDGDVSFVDETLLSRVIAHAERCSLDHMAVIPDLRPMSPVQAALVAIFGQMFMVVGRAHEMDCDLPRGGIGVGAFNLVRRPVYERVGGHRLLKMDLADDLKLGKLIKESGARQRLFNGLGLIRCPWHRGALNVLRGLEKNFFAGFDFSLPKLGLWTAIVLALNFGPVAVGMAATLLVWSASTPLVLIAAWLPFALQASLVAGAYFVEARRQGYNVLTLTLLHPLSVLLLVAAAWNSALRTLSRGGVVWRGTFYPLTHLRAGLVRPGDGRAYHATEEAIR